MSPLQRLNGRVRRFRYFKQSEYDNLLQSWTNFDALFCTFSTSSICPIAWGDQTLDGESRWLVTNMLYINLQMFLYPYIWNSFWSPLTCYMPLLSREYEHQTYSAVVASWSSKLSVGVFICLLSLASSANRLMLADVLTTQGDRLYIQQRNTFC